MTRRQLLAYIAVCLIWGSTWAAIRIAVVQSPPVRVAAVRFLAAGLLMLLVASVRKVPLPRGRAMRVSILFGVAMIGVQYALVFQAQRAISSGLTAILYASAPLVVGVISPAVLKRPVPRAALTAMLVGVGGLLLLLRSIVADSASQMVPAMMMLIGVVISSVCSVYASKELRQTSAFTSLAVQFTVGGLLLGVLSGITERNQPGGWTASSLGALLFLVFFSSVAGFTLYFWLLKTLEPWRVITVQFLIPIISVLEGTLLLRERIPMPELLGGCVVMAAVVLVLRIPADADSYLHISDSNHDAAH
jgi:drug/metabolite transporter (DMT)-like permease